MGTQLIVALCALEHLGFMVLEMFLWSHPVGLRIFGRTLQEQRSSAVLAANQGLYNGFLAVGLLWSLYPEGLTPALRGCGPCAHALQGFFLGCVAVAGLFGGATVSRRIALVQGLPALLGLLCLHQGW
jgi:putative membrane protein